MKWLQNGNLAKLVAFFVISIVVTCTVSFAANGWESFVDDGTSSDNIVSENNSGEVKDPTTEQAPGADIPVVLPQQKYYHSITGLEIEANASLNRPVCLVFASSDPLYGISSSYLTIEIPTEYGNTRLLCFTDDAKTLGKIGSLAPSRGYISNLASYFGGLLLCYGNDDSVKYEYSEADETLDFSATLGYCYTEYNSFVYTNGDLVNAFLNNSKVNQTISEIVTLPYEFYQDGEGMTDGQIAENINISYKDGNTTQLVYSYSENCYLLSKNAAVKTDLLNDKALKYDNAFILYADSTTYESENTTELIMDTYSSGSGIFMNGGRYIEITWEKDSSGYLVIYDQNGDKLSVSRGTTYISFVKSSMKSSVKVS
jgi:hypothetical protein